VDEGSRNIALFDARSGWVVVTSGAFYSWQTNPAPSVEDAGWAPEPVLTGVEK